MVWGCQNSNSAHMIVEIIKTSQDFLIKNEADFVQWADFALSGLSDNQRAIYLGGVAFLCILFLIHELQVILSEGKINRKLAAVAEERPRILNEGKERRVLILGDSTAYGTGADRVEDSLAGRFAHDFPQVEINNYAVNGSVSKDVARQIDNAQGKHYNLIVISTGGNDTWHFISYKKVEQNLRTAIIKAKELVGNNVVLIVYNNISSGPIFPFFLRYIIFKRTEVISSICTRLADEYTIEAVPIFLEGERCPANFFAKDGLHPSSEGYRIMYVRLWATLHKFASRYNLREL
jgi:lysophospholipase L1-like esterase